MSTNETRDLRKLQEVVDAQPPRPSATEEQQRALGRREAIVSQIEANLVERKRLFEEAAKADAECVEWERSAEPRADIEALTYALASCEKLVPRELTDDRKRCWHLILDGTDNGHWMTFRDLANTAHAPSQALLDLLNGRRTDEATLVEANTKELAVALGAAEGTPWRHLIDLGTHLRKEVADHYEAEKAMRAQVAEALGMPRPEDDDVPPWDTLLARCRDTVAAPEPSRHVPPSKHGRPLRAICIDCQYVFTITQNRCEHCKAKKMTDATALKKETEEKGDARDALVDLARDLGIKTDGRTGYDITADIRDATAEGSVRRQLVVALNLPPGTGASWDELLERVRMLATTGGNVELPKGEPRVAPRPDVPKVNSRWRDVNTGSGPHVVESTGKTHAWVRSPGGGTTPVDFDQFGTNLVPWPIEAGAAPPQVKPLAAHDLESLIAWIHRVDDARCAAAEDVARFEARVDSKVERLARDLAGLVALTEAEARRLGEHHTKALARAAEEHQHLSDDIEGALRRVAALEEKVDALLAEGRERVEVQPKIVPRPGQRIAVRPMPGADHVDGWTEDGRVAVTPRTVELLGLKSDRVFLSELFDAALEAARQRDEASTLAHSLEATNRALKAQWSARLEEAPLDLSALRILCSVDPKDALLLSTPPLLPGRLRLEVERHQQPAVCHAVALDPAACRLLARALTQYADEQEGKGS